MVKYRRVFTPGATYFFTFTLQDRQSSYLTTHNKLSGEAFRKIRAKLCFNTQAIVLLPDPLHFIWQMPEWDHDYSTRIRLIKTQFTQSLIKRNITLEKNPRGYVNLWQKRFSEHRIRDEA